MNGISSGLKSNAAIETYVPKFQTNRKQEKLKGKPERV
jgi:hypothetical protein